MMFCTMWYDKDRDVYELWIGQDCEWSKFLEFSGVDYVHYHALAEFMTSLGIGRRYVDPRILIRHGVKHYHTDD